MMQSNFKYRGITYPSFLRHRFIQKLWKKYMCQKREIHLFDEVLTSGSTDGNHYLVCDCCQLMIYIDRIDDKYTD